MSDAPEMLDGGAETLAQATLGTTTSASGSANTSSTSAGALVSRGAVIGRYVVLSKLGAGGMGIVLAAYDPELDRKIALKLLKSSGNSSTRTRLRREAQALAKLDHRNVVTVHDVGDHEGQLFVAMEFVAGKTLRAWMAEVERPRPWREVLRVFAEAGRGLVAAHEANLVHRDFKPDNVMLGDDGRVRVMDFGLARAESDEVEAVDLETSLDLAAGENLLASPLTQTGAVLGTPAYMAPEQFEGTAADARSDQFGFCVALYEALYGTRPFAAKTLSELHGALMRGQVEPAPKGTSVPMRLRAIVVRGLAPEPDQRWPSMRALLDALAEDPAARRRKWFAIAGVIGLLGGATWGVAWAVRADARTCAGFEERLAGVWDESRRAQVEAAIAGTKLSYAAETWERVEQGLDEYTQEWVAAREQACEATHAGEQSDELLDLRMACLDERLQHVRATVDVLARADEMVVAKAVEAVASLPKLERCADADALRSSIPPPEDPEVEKRVAALDEQLVKAKALQRMGKFAEGLRLVDEVVSEGTSIGYEPLLARAWLRRGALQEDMGNYELAEATLKQAYESALGQQMPSEAAEASSTLMYVVGYRLARHEEGRTWAMHAKALVRAVGTDDLFTEYLGDLAALAELEGKYEEARDLSERALAIEEKALGPEHLGVARSLVGLGNVVEIEGKYEEAREYQVRALGIFEKVLGPEHPEMSSALANLGVLAAREGKYQEARDYFERALVVTEKALGPEHPDVAALLLNLGTVANREQRYEEARGYHQRALTLKEKALGLEHPDVATCLNNLGNVAESEGKYEEARGHYERALAIFEKVLGPEHPSLGFPLTNLGAALLALGKPGEAIPHLERAQAIRSANPGSPTMLALTRFTLARASWEAPVEAGRDRERARALAELARQAYAEAGENKAKELREVEAWQAEHRE